MRAVAYCRYSTDNQQENSIMYQINAAQEFCKKHDMELLNIYSDEPKQAPIQTGMAFSAS